MLVYITGQPCSGKTTIADMIRSFYNTRYDFPVNIIEGDTVRRITGNQRYDIHGRYENIFSAHNIADALNHKDNITVLSIVSPYESLRDGFVKAMGGNVLTVYLYTDTPRCREEYQVKDYEPPAKPDIACNTTSVTPEETFNEINVLLLEFLAKNGTHFETMPAGISFTIPS